jgi:5-methyltetrahydropteroyltriglutamate--homocysteine methyltransferase
MEDLSMTIPTEPIGSIPRTSALIEGMRDLSVGRISHEPWRFLCDWAIHDTIDRLEATGSPVITDGEQTKPSFATYPIHGLTNLAPDGVVIPFADGHVRQLPRLTASGVRCAARTGAIPTAPALPSMGSSITPWSR